MKIKSWFCEKMLIKILFRKHFHYGKMLSICDYVSKSEQLAIKFIIFFENTIT